MEDKPLVIMIIGLAIIICGSISVSEIHENITAEKMAKLGYEQVRDGMIIVWKKKNEGVAEMK